MEVSQKIENANAAKNDLPAEYQNFDVVRIVVQPTWREFLLDLVAKEKMDPWNVDVTRVADAYLARVRELRAMDLRLPANVILACAILVKLKADRLIIEDEDEENAPRELVQEELPQLVLRNDRPRARRVTLKELMRAVEDVMRTGKKLTRIEPGALEFLELDAPAENIGERMQKVFDRAHALKDAEGLLLFSALVAHARGDLNGSAARTTYAESVVAHLLPVLHLVQEKKMLAWQDDVFGEIFLKVLREGELEEIDQTDEEKQSAGAVESASEI